MKLIFKSEDKLEGNFIKSVVNVDSINQNNIDEVISSFLTFLFRCGADNTMVIDFIIALGIELSNNEEDMCKAEDCEKCDLSDRCSVKDDVVANAIAKAEETIKSTSNENFEDLLNDEDYIKNFKQTLLENDTILKSVLKNYLYNVKNNNLQK